MDEVVFLYTTWPDALSAEAAGREAVEAGLCACVNVLAPMTSVYRWKDVVETAAETPMIVKTTTAAAKAARDFLTARHPYDTPAVAALKIAPEGSSPAFLAWIAEESSAGRRR